MESITLVRHADSVRAEIFHKKRTKKAKSDLDRPLSKNGKIQSKAIARFLSLNAKFDMMICSTAKRARQTFKPIAKRFSTSEIIFSDSIAPDCGIKGYIALNEIQKIRSIRHLLIVGHQPDLELFAKWLCPSLCCEVPKGVIMCFHIDAFSADSAPLREGSAVLSYLIAPHLLLKG